MQPQAFYVVEKAAEQEKAISPEDCANTQNPGADEGTEGSGKWEGYNFEILNAIV